MKMDPSEITLILDKNADELYSEANQSISFTGIVQNLSSRYFSRVSVDLQGPPEVKIIRSHKVVGGIPSRSRRRVSFKIQPYSNGLHVLNAIINVKQVPKCTVPIILRVGQESLNLKAPDSKIIQVASANDPPQNDFSQGISNSMINYHLKDNAEAIYCDIQ